MYEQLVVNQLISEKSQYAYKRPRSVARGDIQLTRWSVWLNNLGASHRADVAFQTARDGA